MEQNKIELPNNSDVEIDINNNLIGSIEIYDAMFEENGWDDFKIPLPYGEWIISYRNSSKIILTKI